MTDGYRLLITIITILFSQDIINYNFFVYFFIFLIMLLVIYFILDWYLDFGLDNVYELNEDFNLFKPESNSSNGLELPADSDNEDDISISMRDLKYKEPVNTNKKTHLNIIPIKTIIKKDTISDINDLILIASYYESNIASKYIGSFDNNLYRYGDKYYTINLDLVYRIKGPLIKLKKMVGLTEIKNEIIDLVLYYLSNRDDYNNGLKHITLEGGPGCGKTKLAKILSQILSGLNILDSGKIIYAKTTDLIGQYVGQTGPKTQKLINRALGGILFIDEAYGLGETQGLTHNFSSECINVLNQNLSDNKNKFICIIAGYSKELEQGFFSVNPGLKRRFPFRFKINPYTWSELLKIFIQKIYRLGWRLYSEVDLETFFKNNIRYFKYMGGDIDTLIQNIQYSHFRRIICEDGDKRKIITNADIESGFTKFKNARKISDKEKFSKRDFIKRLLKMKEI